jgi:hypothetical protein
MIGSLLSCRIRGFLQSQVGICLLAISLISTCLDEGVRRKEMDGKVEIAGITSREVVGGRGDERGHTVKPPINNVQHH